ncbi:MAG: 30S ribosomal protein S1 [Lachnospiraceae bacterium]
MSEISFEQMLEDSFKNIHVGDVVEGTVINVTPEEIAVNIGYKSDGIVTKHEYTNNPAVDLTSVVKPGEKINVKVIKMNDGDGQVVLSYKRLLAEKVSKVLEDALNDKTVLKAVVSEVVKGGIKVVVDDVAVFIPASLASDTSIKDLSVMEGQEVEFIITEYNPKKRRCIGDCRTVLRERKEAMRAELISKFQEGDIIEGEVKNVTSFGAFVDIGGLDGLLHISEMSWGHVDKPSNVLSKGDKVKVIIKEIKGDKIALSVRFDENNPWLKAADKYAIGTVVKGKVARMTDFGAFIQLEEGIDALLHVSQIARYRVEKPSDVLKIGDEIEAEVVDLNVEDRKISLSMKVLAPEEEQAENVDEGTEE